MPVASAPDPASTNTCCAIFKNLGARDTGAFPPRT
jgi:hypothetical protein